MNTVIVDGHNAAYRYFHARGSAIPGFISLLIQFKETKKYDEVIVVFDSLEKRERGDGEYKGHRKDVPEQLEQEFPQLVNLSKLLGFKTYVASGDLEGDDVIASLAIPFQGSKDDHVYVHTVDKDLAQLVTEGVTWLHPTKGEMGAADVEEKFGVTPAQIASYLTLAGDSSDNIAGVEGVGPKTAAKALQEHKTLKGVAEAAVNERDRVFNKKQRKNFINDMRTGEMAKRYHQVHLTSYEGIEPEPEGKDLDKAFEILTHHGAAYEVAMIRTNYHLWT